MTVVFLYQGATMAWLKQRITVLGIWVLVLIPAIWGLTCQSQAQERIVLATLDWPPYVGQDLEGQGYTAVIVKEAFRRSNIEVDIRFNQWSRVIGLARRGEVDGYFPEYYAKSIQAYARFSDPIPAGPLGFFKRADSDIEFTGLKALIPYRIGVVKGYINTTEFDAANFLDKHLVNDDLSNFKLLLAGRVDLVVADKYVGNYLIREHMPEQFSKIVFLPRLLEKKEVYLCIGSGKKNTYLFLNAFNSGLRQMKADGSLARLLPRGDNESPILLNNFQNLP